MNKKKQSKVRQCGSCGSALDHDEELICVLCVHLGPDVPCSLSPDQLLEIYGPVEGVPLAQVADLNEFKKARGLPVYFGEEVDTPHHYAGDAHLRDIHGNPLF